MFKIYILFLFSLLFNFNVSNLFAENNALKINTNSTKKLDWESSASNVANELDW